MYLVSVPVREAAEAYVVGRQELEDLQATLLEATLSGDDSDLMLDVELMVAEAVRGDRSERSLREALKELLPALASA